VASAVEPGSTQKILTAAAAIDTGNADKLSEVAVPSELEIDGQTITDAFEHEDEDRGWKSPSSSVRPVSLGSTIDESASASTAPSEIRITIAVPHSALSSSTADGVRIPVAPQDETAAQDGSSIELSLDRDVQFYTTEPAREPLG
jgi:cell division protein FtsI/penicillin-binding protein 2